MKHAVHASIVLRARRFAARLGLVLAWGIAVCPAARAAAGQDASLLPRPGLQALQSSTMQAPEPQSAMSSLPPPRELKWGLLLSAALPGAGEYYAGHMNRALAFGTVEAGIWISYATFKVQEDLRSDRAIEYAVAVAGAVPPDPGDGIADDDYFAAMAQFQRSEGQGQWNEFVRRRARDTGEVVGVEYTGDAAWAWPSEDHFVRYRDIRKSQLEAEDNATNMLAVAIVNRIASMVDVFQAMRSDAKQREELQQGFGLHLRLGHTPREPLACLLLQRRF